MSRLNYSDNEDFPGQFALWQANCRRSLKSKRGQEALREVRAAILALSSKRLVNGEIEKDGEVCAIGAVIKARGLLDEVDETEVTDAIAVDLLGFPKMVVWKLVEVNDEQCATCTPENRYRLVLAYIEELLR